MRGHCGSDGEVTVRDRGSGRSPTVAPVAARHSVPGSDPRLAEGFPLLQSSPAGGDPVPGSGHFGQSEAATCNPLIFWSLSNQRERERERATGFPSAATSHGRQGRISCWNSPAVYRDGESTGNAELDNQDAKSSSSPRDNTLLPVTRTRTGVPSSQKYADVADGRTVQARWSRQGHFVLLSAYPIRTVRVRYVKALYGSSSCQLCRRTLMPT